MSQGSGSNDAENPALITTLKNAGLF